MTTGWVICGIADSSVIVRTPLPGMLKTIVSRSPVSAFESRIACRSEPTPPLLVLVTTIWRHRIDRCRHHDDVVRWVESGSSDPTPIVLVSVPPDGVNVTDLHRGTRVRPGVSRLQ